MSKPVTVIVSRKVEGASRNALRFFGVAFAILLVGLAIFLCCAHFLGRQTVSDRFVFPEAFLVSSVLLGLGSLAMHKANYYVRMEKQQRFRKWLITALILGALFTGIQSYGLWSMLPSERTAQDAVLGVTGFVIALSTLHALHFCVAELFLTYITVRTWADRYDHEYYWGVTVCSWFWHFLGIVWIAILAVIAIVL